MEEEKMNTQNPNEIKDKPVEDNKKSKKQDDINLAEDKVSDYKSLVAQMQEEDLALLFEKVKMADLYLDTLQRLKADYENYQKRIERDRLTLMKYVHQPLMVKLIGVQDILDKAISAGAQSQDKNFFDGICLANKEFQKILQDFSVQKVKAVGEKFNPLYHEALRQVESDKPDMTIVEEIQTGYILHDRLLRASKVVVSRKITPASSPEPPKAEPQKTKESTAPGGHEKQKSKEGTVN